MTLLFRTPDFREAALLRQPFVLDGVTVKLLRDGEAPDTTWVSVSTGYLVHAALRDYPIEQRTEKGIRWNCCRLGYVREIDPAVLQIDHPREIPHQLRIDYSDNDGPTSVVPVEIVRVWHHSHSYYVNGQYVSLFHPRVAAA